MMFCRLNQGMGILSGLESGLGEHGGCQKNIVLWSILTIAYW